jgi:capsular polysaccharide transport system permease protein
MDALPTTPRHKRTPWEIQRAVWFALLQRELKARFGGRWLGAFWVLVEPLAHIGYVMLLFGVIRDRIIPGVPFSMFLLTGLIPFFIFRSVSLRVMGSVDGSRGLFGYRQVKPIDPIVARAALDILLYSVIFAIFVIAFAWVGIEAFPAHPLEALGCMVVLIALALGLGLLYVVLTDDVPQLRIFIRLAYLPLYLISGVIFPLSMLPQAMLEWLLWNPLLHLLERLRGFYFDQYQPLQQTSLKYPGACALVVLAAGLGLYRLRRNRLLAT